MTTFRISQGLLQIIIGYFETDTEAQALEMLAAKMGFNAYSEIEHLMPVSETGLRIAALPTIDTSVAVDDFTVEVTDEDGDLMTTSHFTLERAQQYAARHSKNQGAYVVALADGVKLGHLFYYDGYIGSRVGIFPA